MNAENRTERRILLLLLGLVLLLHLACFFHIRANRHVLFTFDSWEYLQAADNLRTHGVLYAGDLSEPVTPDLFTRRPPLYPLLLSFLRSAWPDSQSITLFNLALGLLNGYLLWRLSAQVGLSSRIRLATVAAFFFYPAQIVYTHMVMSEILLQTLLLLSVFFFFQFQKSGNLTQLWLVNASLALGLLTKPSLMLIWIPGLVFHLWLFLRSRRKVVLLAALVPVLAVAAWSYRNYLKTGHFHFSSMAGEMEARYLRWYDRVEYPDAPWPQVSSPRVEGWATEQREVRTSLYQRFARNPLAVARLQVMGIGFFFLDPGRFDLHHFQGSRFSPGLARHLGRTRQILGQTPLPLLALLALIGLVNLAVLAAYVAFPFQKSPPAEVKVFVFFLVLYAAVMTIGIGRSRYRLSVMPELFLVSAIVLNKATARYSGRSRT